MSYWGVPITIQNVETNPVNNEGSTRETIVKMIGIAKACSGTSIIHSIVDEVIRGTKPKSQTDVARGLFHWVKGHVSFRQDEDTVANELGYEDANRELLIAPIVLVQMPSPMGDCDDFSILSASLCMAAKIPVWFVTIAVDEMNPDVWSHVFCMVKVDGEIIPFDASHGNCLGWMTNRTIFKSAVYFVG